MDLLKDFHLTYSTNLPQIRLHHSKSHKLQEGNDFLRHGNKVKPAVYQFLDVKGPVKISY